MVNQCVEIIRKCLQADLKTCSTFRSRKHACGKVNLSVCL